MRTRKDTNSGSPN